MNKFLFNILYYLIAIAIIAFVFEYLFTNSHYKNVPRNPVSWAMSMDSTNVYDYVVLGSSRALHHVDPLQIEKLTGKRGLNLGLQDAKPFDIKLFVRHLIDKKITNSIYVQIDDSWNIDQGGEKSSLNWLPFIDEVFVWEEFEKLGLKKYHYYKHIPFYKYARYESEIGIRDYIKGLIGQELSTIKDMGYISLEEVMKDQDRSKKYLIDIKDTVNIHLEEVLTLSEVNHVKITFFTAPIYNSEGNHSILKKYLPNYYDYTDSISDPKYFADSRHLNSEGAKIFVNKMIDLFK